MCLPIALVAVRISGGVMMDSYVYAITALLPLVALMVVFESNPYQALILRGILGAVAALVYTVLGAADVALTEALVGTLLAITLYAVAVRSSMVLRLGVLKEEDQETHFRQLIEAIRSIFGKLHMRVELVSYLDKNDLHQALIDKEVHGICAPTELEDESQSQPYHTKIRLQRLYEIMQTELASSLTVLTYVSTSDVKEKN
jgi:putative multicomponent Na+:H+ antiporter subunit B